MHKILIALLVLVVPEMVACGEASPSGIGEPLRIAGGAFKDGPLPGTGTKGTAADAKVTPQVTAIVSLPSVLRPSASEVPFEARATKDAYAVGIRFANLGSGYWVFPLAEPDVVNRGELIWRVSASLGAEIAPGNHELELVAFDRHGHAGLKRTRSVCVVPAFDDNLNSCDATIEPPAAVISLAWSTDMDLDLRVRTPSGKLVDATHPSTRAAGDGGVPSDAGETSTGFFDHDSNPDCTLDSQRHESLVWQEAPEPGTYTVYVNVFDACGRAAADFELSSYERRDGKQEGTYRLVPSAEPIRGQVLGASANGGTRPGTFVARIKFR